MKKILYLSFIPLLLTSCFVTTFGYVKSNNGVIPTNQNIPITINILENQFIDKGDFEKLLVEKLNKYQRVPNFDLSDNFGNDSSIFTINIKNLVVDTKVLDETVSKQNEEKEQYLKSLKKYEEDKEFANFLNKEPPSEVLPPTEETVLYKIKRFIISVNLETFLESGDSSYKDTLLVTISKDMVIEHKVKKIGQTKLFTYTPTNNALINLTSEIFTGILNSLIPQKNERKIGDIFTDSEVIDSLKKSLFLEMTYKIISKISSYFASYIKKEIHLLPITKEIDNKINEILSNQSLFLNIFDYLKNIENKKNEDSKARIYFNLSILYFYYKEPELSKYYYDLGNETKFGWETANLFNSIIPQLGDNYLR